MNKTVISLFIFLSMISYATGRERVFTNEDLKEQPPQFSTPQKNQPAHESQEGTRSPDGNAKDNPSASKAVNPGPPKSSDITSGNVQINPKGRTDNRPLARPEFHSRDILTLVSSLKDSTLAIIAIGSFCFFIWIICLVDILKNEFSGSNKMIWLVAVTLLPAVGPLLYYFIGLKQKVSGSIY